MGRKKEIQNPVLTAARRKKYSRGSKTFMKFAEPIFHITGCAAAIAAAFLFPGRLPAAVCEMPDSSLLNLAEFTGADAFYRLGIYGQGANVANLEYYSVSAEEAPEYSVFLKDSNYSTYLPEGTSGRHGSAHPYETLSVMAGYNESYEKQEVSTGIAWRATYTARQVAEDGLFTSDRLTLQTYEKFFSNGADVISSSFKNSGESSFMAGAILDSYAAKNARTVFVGAAANDGGEGPGNVASPYRNMNVIKVGALDASTGFKTVAAFSSYGPNDFYNPITGETAKGAVSAVDISAPGTVYTVKQDESLGNVSGTSFAAPIVSSAAALMVSYSKETSMPDDSRDARLIKAVLLNSASKTDGWDNGSRLESATANGKTYAGVLSTRQALDYRSGAGALNAEEALAQYGSFGETSFLDSAVKGESVFYDFSAAANLEFTATLCWNIGAEIDGITYDGSGNVSAISAENSHFANLDLRLWYLDGGGEILVAQSVSEYNNVEHLFLALEREGEYRLEAAFKDMVYGDAESETFAVAWNVSQIPEPSVCAALLGAAALAFAARRKATFSSGPNVLRR